MKNKKRICCIEGDRSGCGMARIIQPVREIQNRNLEDLDFVLYSDVHNNDVNVGELNKTISSYDVVVVQRVCNPVLVNSLREAQKRGTKIIIELDDALFDVSPRNVAYNVWNKTTQQWKALKDALSFADYLWVSTPELIDIYGDHFSKDRILVTLNAINLNDPIYDHSNHMRHKLPKDKVIIQWLGSTSHEESLGQITKAIKKVIEKYDNTMFALCSNKEFLSYFDIPDSRKIYIKPREVDQYPPLMSCGDINLATVKPSRFNSGKSELKVLESSAWSVPSVCTYVQPYNRFNKISGGANFTVFENQTNEWVRKISLLVENEELRKQMGHNSYLTVKNHYSLSGQNDLRINHIRKILN